jgi:para-nitrobenzyl esterase
MMHAWQRFNDTWQCQKICQSTPAGEGMKDKLLPNAVSRRCALGLSAAAGLAFSVLGDSVAQPKQTASAGGATANGSGTVTTPRSAVARTAYGMVRGYVEDGVLVFKGIPYGADTGGANRWLPPKPPQSWNGERPALIYGANSPQNPHWWDRAEVSFLLQWDDGYMSEDMLKLNVWTPSLSGRRPVMVYLHGGAFFFGSAHELPSQDGTRLARNHDVVSVTVGHRLNALGFLDVAEVGGPAYADSANVGMADLVFALQWVRDNIANFGGDPENVMIYGQSGGGAKVRYLLGMPSAAGLFHRAAIQSAGAGIHRSAVTSRSLAHQLMTELGVGPHDWAKLRHLEWSRLNEAGASAIGKLTAALSGEAAASLNMLPGLAWGPSPGNQTATGRSIDDEVPELSKHIPLLIGSVTEEGFPIFGDPADQLSEADWRVSLVRTYGETRAEALTRALRKAHPDKSITKLAAGVAGLQVRNQIQRLVRQRQQQGGAPVYQYVFSWQSPQLDGRGGAWHTLDLAFCFDNTERCAQGTGNTPQAQTLARKMAAAWAAFARTGNPSTAELNWPATDAEHVQTMVFDDHCRMENDPDGDARKSISPQS